MPEVSTLRSTSNTPWPKVNWLKVKPPTTTWPPEINACPAVLTASSASPNTLSVLEVPERFKRSLSCRVSVSGPDPPRSMISMSSILLSEIVVRSRVESAEPGRSVSSPAPPST